MKYFLIIFDGMADEPIAELDGKTPMQAAKKPFMNRIAELGKVGAVRTTPEGMYPGSDVTNMNILGYDPRKYYRGRAAIEAASLGIPMLPTDIAFRANLVSTDGELMLDSSGGHISTEEAVELIKVIDSKLSTNIIKFFPGVSYRHIMIWHNGSMDVKLAAPYKFHGEPFSKFLPEGDGESKLKSLIYDSYEILNNHPINRKRKDEGHLPANMLWFWGEGIMPSIPSFTDMFGKTGSCVAAVDLIKGLGKMVGLKVLDVPGATGYIDTNYLNKGLAAVESMQNGDFVWVHVEAADEAGHEKKLDKKIEAIQEEDEKVLGTILNGIKALGEDARILVLPDHPTPIATGSHSPAMVPFILYDSTKLQSNNIPYDEQAVEETKLKVENASELLPLLFKE
jgi:2,3-bisphosphoglycerate-independent phosphoglycerate mutase